MRINLNSPFLVREDCLTVSLNAVRKKFLTLESDMPSIYFFIKASFFCVSLLNQKSIL